MSLRNYIFGTLYVRRKIYILRKRGGIPPPPLPRRVCSNRSIFNSADHRRIKYLLIIKYPLRRDLFSPRYWETLKLELRAMFLNRQCLIPRRHQNQKKRLQTFFNLLSSLGTDYNLLVMKGS